VAPHWVNWTTDWSDWLDASAYDGVAASLINSLPLPTTWPHPLLVSGSNVFLGRPDNTAATGQLEVWTLSGAGKFLQLGTTQLGSVVSSLNSFGSLLAVQQNAGTLVFDVSSPAAPTVIGKGAANGCFGYDVSRGDASRAGGLWLPLGDYGVSRIEFSP